MTVKLVLSDPEANRANFLYGFRAFHDWCALHHHEIMSREDVPVYVLMPEWQCFGFWFYIVSFEPMPGIKRLGQRALSDILPEDSSLVLEHLSSNEFDRSWVIARLSDVPARLDYEDAVSYLMARWGIIEAVRVPNRLHRVHHRESRIWHPWIENFIAYELHMRFTGHSAGVNFFLRECRDYIRGRVVDLGSGPGSRARLLKSIIEEAGPKGELILVDICDDSCELSLYTAAMLNAALEREGQCFVLAGKADFCEAGDWERYPALSRVDACVCSYVLHWLGPGLSRALENIARHLSEGGHLVVVSECPMRISESPFSRFAHRQADERLLSGDAGVSLEELTSICQECKLELVKSLETEVQTLEGRDRHVIFGAVYQKRG